MTRKPKLQRSKDGAMRRTRRVEIRLTEQEETVLDLMYMDFLESSEANPTFADFLAILLRRYVTQELAETQAAMEENKLL